MHGFCGNAQPDMIAAVDWLSTIAVTDDVLTAAFKLAPTSGTNFNLIPFGTEEWSRKYRER